MHGRTLLLLLLTGILTGCDSAGTTGPTEQPTAIGNEYHEADCGSINGQVCWYGETPQFALYHAPFSTLGEQGGGLRRSWANPNLPVVDANRSGVFDGVVYPLGRLRLLSGQVVGGGVKDAVVFLRNVDLAKSRPWNHPAVEIEFRDDELLVVQGDYAGRRGFVQRGTQFTVVSKQSEFEALQARGDAFFSLTLPSLGMARARKLERCGVVELSSGVGRFWMRGHLFVAEHPYYARTDAAGRFTLPQVPPGKYQIVCWHPNWHEDVREHDADTCSISRVTFLRAAEIVKEIVVPVGATAKMDFLLQPNDFAAEPQGSK